MDTSYKVCADQGQWNVRVPGKLSYRHLYFIPLFEIFYHCNLSTSLTIFSKIAIFTSLLHLKKMQ